MSNKKATNSASASNETVESFQPANEGDHNPQKSSDEEIISLQEIAIEIEKE
jgi:hypothetical protein